jgi:hypothetical protein
MDQLKNVLGSTPNQRLATLPAIARATHRTILRAFADTGSAPNPDTLAGLELLATHDLIGRTDTGEIAYAYPFSARPTAHRVRLPGGAQPYAMCAIDALGIPTMLDTDAVITSRDAHSGEPITVTVTDHGRTAHWQPTQAVVFLGSRTSCCATTSAESCCGYLNFFTSHHTATEWAREHPDIHGTILEQHQALDAGIHCFGNLLHDSTSQHRPLRT